MPVLILLISDPFSIHTKGLMKTKHDVKVTRLVYWKKTKILDYILLEK